MAARFPSLEGGLVLVQRDRLHQLRASLRLSQRKTILAQYSFHIAQVVREITTHAQSGFKFKRPQQLAALLLLLLVAQCLWVFHRQTLTSRDYDFARCGREMWEKPNPLVGYFTTCGNIPDGTLGYRVAGLPLTLQRIDGRPS